MNNASRLITDWAVFGMLVVAGVAGRFLFLDVPNFKPSTAIALFAGYYLAKRRFALLVPIAILLISNLWLDSYMTWFEMIVVYAAFLVPVLMGRSLLRPQPSRGTSKARWVTCAVVPSMIFFISTNFAVWLSSGMYARDLAGLQACYVMALPFYGFTLAGDLVFVPVVFGCYHLARLGTRGMAFGLDASQATS